MLTGAALWTTILVACGAVFLLKLAGHVIPASWLSHRRLRPVIALVAVGLLAALTANQTLAADGALVIDARAAALAVAAIALWRRMPFIVVVILAAVTAAALRALGVG